MSLRRSVGGAIGVLGGLITTPLLLRENMSDLDDLVSFLVNTWLSSVMLIIPSLLLIKH